MSRASDSPSSEPVSTITGMPAVATDAFNLRRSSRGSWVGWIQSWQASQKSSSSPLQRQRNPGDEKHHTRSLARESLVRLPLKIQELPRERSLGNDAFADLVRHRDRLPLPQDGREGFGLAEDLLLAGGALESAMLVEEIRDPDRDAVDEHDRLRGADGRDHVEGSLQSLPVRRAFRPMALDPCGHLGILVGRDRSGGCNEED